MRAFEIKEYMEDVSYIAGLELPWEKLANKSVLISGATGMIGSLFVDVIMECNKRGLNCRVYALGRSKERAKERFLYCWNDSSFKFIEHDISKPIESAKIGEIDYVLHLASNTHPVLYSTEPIQTITTNIIGTYNMLEFAAEKKVSRCVLASSNEIYGENRGDSELFDEAYCGYIDCNTLRAGYPESKRCSEALCQAYIKQHNLDIVISRFTRTYGPTMLLSDSKASSQFIKKALAGENIVLKSLGTQLYSYTHVCDAVSGLLTVLLKGECGKAYNIADEKSDVMLKDLAAIIANNVGKQVVYEIPDDVELKGYSTVTKARLDSTKLKKLGWRTKYDIDSGIRQTLKVLSEMYPN